jgi:hypothetical protein
MRLSIRPVGSQVGGNGIDLLAELFVHGIDFFVQGVDLEINQINEKSKGSRLHISLFPTTLTLPSPGTPITGPRPLQSVAAF